jgi:hypothetical protein
MNKLFTTIALSLIIVGLIIGTHQTITVGFQGSYWIFMLTLVIYLVFAYYRDKNKK